MRYAADITAGSLKLRESRVIASLSLQDADKAAWQRAILKKMCCKPVGRRVYLYASARKDEKDREAYAEIGLKFGDLQTGVIVGTMVITECDGQPGDYAWTIADPQRFDLPLKPEKNPQPVWVFPFSKEDK